MHTDLEAPEVKDSTEKHQNGTSRNEVMHQDRRGKDEEEREAGEFGYVIYMYSPTNMFLKYILMKLP